MRIPFDAALTTEGQVTALEFMSWLAWMFFQVPGAPFVWAATVILLAPLSAVVLFREQSLSSKARRILRIAVACVSVLIVFTPSVIEATVGYDPNGDNIGWWFILLGLFLYGLPLLVACLIPSAATAGVAWLVSRKKGDAGRKQVALKSGLFAGVVLFVPLMSSMLWFAVGMGMTG